MANWVPFHEELRQGAKRGLPRAVRFIFLELAMECRKGRGIVRLPVGMDDVDAVHDLLGGRRSEIEEALHVLTTTLPGEEGGMPMVVLEGPERARTLRIPCWAKWNHKEAPGASTERVQLHRARLKQLQVLAETATYCNDHETTCNENETVGNAPTVQVQDREISPEPPERRSETSMPPDPPSARVGGVGQADDHDDAVHGLTSELVAGVLTQEVFAPMFQDGWIDDLTMRLSAAGVRLADIRLAAEDFALKRTGDGLHGKRLVTAFAGFAAAEKRNRQAAAAKDRPLEQPERVAMDLWRELWSKAHGGVAYAVSAKDPDYIRAITARAKVRASELDNQVRGREVLRYYFTRYLAIDDKSLIKKRYPLSLLDAHMPAIGEYEPPRPKPPAPPPSAPRSSQAPAKREPLPDLTSMLDSERQKRNGRLVPRARA